MTVLLLGAILIAAVLVLRKETRPSKEDPPHDNPDEPSPAPSVVVMNADSARIETTGPGCPPNPVVDVEIVPKVSEENAVLSLSSLNVETSTSAKIETPLENFESVREPLDPAGPSPARLARRRLTFEHMVAVFFGGALAAFLVSAALVSVWTINTSPNPRGAEGPHPAAANSASVDPAIRPLGTPETPQPTRTDSSRAADSRPTSAILSVEDQTRAADQMVGAGLKTPYPAGSSAAQAFQARQDFAKDQRLKLGLQKGTSH